MPPGRYEHWKGGIYRVLGHGLHTETDEVFVVYVDEDQSGVGSYYLRPLDNFTATIHTSDGARPRFRPLT